MISLLPFATYYFCYFAYNGLFNPFWGLYLESLSFSPWQISLLIALSTMARIVAPGFWGWLADRRRQRRPIVVATSLMAALGFLLICLHAKTFVWVFFCLALVHFFWAASLPLVEASTAHLTRSEPGRYSRVRVWGSIGYLILAVAGGYALDWLHLSSLPWLAFGLLCAVLWSAWRLPEVAAPARARGQTSLWGTLRQPPVAALFACCFLMAFAFGPYYTFYSIGLRQAGFDKSAIGWLWAVGVMAEIGVFWFMPRIMGAIALERLMLLSLVAAVLRFSLMALAIGNPLLAVLSQALHAPTFAIHHAASIGLIHRHFAEQHHAKGQGLYIIFSFGIGGSLGGLLSGVLWTHGGVPLVFSLSACAALIGVGVCWRCLRPSRQVLATS
ncbi:MFS transporter [Paludibacterium purpuratum]|uniref:PPP family 3-phenylpropionic acid transporter n=1 Tax=Paludibacterium purpuratum TaxID=1144873 RepID=A0A4R7BB36_9NEIS|nr:MFS transporter [Paludibacterium purpuratum]TDR82108.1 PPP family 3-phenylpropionic acid transporter [Paludibacterium purpuratum]